MWPVWQKLQQPVQLGPTQTSGLGARPVELRHVRENIHHPEGAPGARGVPLSGAGLRLWPVWEKLQVRKSLSKAHQIKTRESWGSVEPETLVDLISSTTFFAQFLDRSGFISEQRRSLCCIRPTAVGSLSVLCLGLVLFSSPCLPFVTFYWRCAFSLSF